MRSQKRWADLYRIVLAQLAGNLQHLLFRFGVETISRLDFNRGHPFIDQPLQTLLRQPEQGLGRTAPRRRHGRVNPAPLRADGLIRDAVQTLLPLCRTIATEHQVGMAVNQPGRDQTTVQIDTVTVAGRDVGFGNNGQNRLAAHHQGVLRFQAIRRAVVRDHCRQSRIAPYYIVGMKLLHGHSTCHGLYRHLFSSAPCCQPLWRKMLFICDDFPASRG